MKTSFVEVADQVAREIAAGSLAPGERLPPQREFAHRRGIASSTASRAYAELARRGLVIGEVGRGTFVRAAPAPSFPALIEPSSAQVDLELIFPMLPAHEGALASALADLATSPDFALALRPIGAAGNEAARETVASFLARPGWAPKPRSILFAGNGRQALAGALAALANPGDRIGVEAMTYPVIKGLAAKLGLTLIPLEMDQQGLIPDSLIAAHRRTPLAAVYLQPSLHSPSGATMGLLRRAAIGETLRSLTLTAIEDGVYSFLAEGDLPLAALASERVIFIESLSKRVAPGLSLGLLSAPDGLVSRLASALRSGAWSAAGLPMAAGCQWMKDGTARRMAADKRADARLRRAVAQEILGDLAVTGDARAYHAWLPLPEPWRAEAFAASALRYGVAVTPGDAFAAIPGHAPAGVRLALASPPLPVLKQALETLRRLAIGEIEGAAVE
ncbi:MAG: PLP-dependent aminotransferase family protein [Elsteraceae bacterium]